MLMTFTPCSQSYSKSFLSQSPGTTVSVIDVLTLEADAPGLHLGVSVLTSQGSLFVYLGSQINFEQSPSLMTWGTEETGGVFTK